MTHKRSAACQSSRFDLGIRFNDLCAIEQQSVSVVYQGRVNLSMWHSDKLIEVKSFTRPIYKIETKSNLTLK